MEIIILLAIAIALWYAFRRPGDSNESSATSRVNSSSSKGGHSSESEVTAPSREARHLRSALQFTKQNYSELSREADVRRQWQRNFGEARLVEIDAMSGVTFEHFLEGLFRAQGYRVETTAASGDFGADLILCRGTERLAVQAKRWQGGVGIAAVQEAISGKSYYACNGAWVITTSRFTSQAQALAEKADVRLIDREALALLIGEKMV